MDTKIWTCLKVVTRWWEERNTLQQALRYFITISLDLVYASEYAYSNHQTSVFACVLMNYACQKNPSMSVANSSTGIISGDILGPNIPIPFIFEAADHDFKNPGVIFWWLMPAPNGQICSFIIIEVV